MKRLFLAIIVLFCMSSLFAEKYTVTDLGGTVTYKSADKFVKIVKGLELEENDLVNVSLQSYLIITDTNGKEITIKSASKGTVKELVLNNFTLDNKKGIRKQTIAKATAVAPDVSVRKGVATAASRASEAKEDFDWDE